MSSPTGIRRLRKRLNWQADHGMAISKTLLLPQSLKFFIKSSKCFDGALEGRVFDRDGEDVISWLVGKGYLSPSGTQP